jgi:hypothetical protein
MPGGKPPPKAAAMAAALGIYNSKKTIVNSFFRKIIIIRE